MRTASPATTALRPPATPTLSTLMSAVTSCRCCVAKHGLAFGPSLYCPFSHPTHDKAGTARLERDLKLYTRLIEIKLKRSPLDMRQHVYLSKLCPSHLAVFMGLPPPTPTSSSSSTTSCTASSSSVVYCSPKPRSSSVPGLEHSLQGESAATAAAAAAATAAAAVAAHAAASANGNDEDAALPVASSNIQQQAGEGEKDRQHQQQQQATSGPADEATEGGEGEEEEAAGEAPSAPPAPAMGGAAEATKQSTEESMRVSVRGGWESERSLWENICLSVCSTVRGVVDLTVLLAQAFSQATCAALGHISSLFTWV